MDLSKIFQKRPALPGRIPLPDVDPGEVEAYRQEADRYVRTRLGYLRAMMGKGAVPFAGKPKPRPKPTRHVRQKRARMARAAYLRGG